MWRTFLILVMGLAVMTCGEKADQTTGSRLTSKSDAIHDQGAVQFKPVVQRRNGPVLDRKALEKMRPRVDPGDSGSRLIIDTDDRVLVSDTSVVPWNRVARVLVEFPGDPGNWYLCSGVMIQSTWVLTAAHCLYDTDLGGYISAAEVIPGLDGSQACPGAGCPFGVFGKNNAYVPPEWVASQDLNYNVGLIELDGNPGVGAFSWALAGYTDLMANLLHSGGFPGDLSVQGDAMYSADGGAHSVTRRLIWNTVDFDPGQSGSAAWHAGVALGLVGVMIAGVDFGAVQLNVAIRLRPELIAWMYQLFGGCSNDCSGPTCTGATTYRDCVLGTDHCLDLGPETDCPPDTTCQNGECYPKGACGSCSIDDDCQTDGFCIYFAGPPAGDSFCTVPCAATPPVCPTGYLCFDMSGQGLDPAFQCLPGAALNGGDICEACTPDECPCSQDNECDDGWYCNGVETCVSGACQTGTPPACDDGVDCTDDSCSFVTDECEHTPNDANCENGLYCDGVETCDLTLGCQAGTPPVADDGVGCTDDSCDEVNDVIANTANDANCDDGFYCNGAETCDPTLDCQAGTAVNCDDSVPCTVDACNDSTDTCDHSPDHDFCDNGQYCDGVEVCDPVNGCGAGTPPSCNDGVICTVDSCNETDDSCEHAATDSVCDDGEYCTGVETCDPVIGCQQGTDIDCDDGVGCTVDTCNEANDVCDNTPDDADCTDGNECTNDVCDPAQGCQHSDNDGVSCSLASCNGTCLAGVCDGCACSTDADCDDGVGCTVDACTSGACTRVPNDALCDDSDYCNGAESCDPLLDCQAGTAVNCDDGQACTDDSCDEVNDVCVSVPNDANCSDDNACNGAEVCDAVLGCGEGVAPDCDDANVCTEDSCDAAAGCQHASVMGDCDDGDDCTMNDECVDGSCAGEPLDMDDDGHVAEECQGDDCDDSNSFVHPDIVETGAHTALCSDGIDNDCDGLIDQEEDGCVSCSDDSDCDDSNECTDDSCDPASGCSHSNNSGSCNDGDECTMNDTCSSGVCLGEPLDEDGDGQSPEECGGYDCDDSDENISPAEVEDCHDGIDNDCNGYIDQEDALCPEEETGGDGGCNCSTHDRHGWGAGMLLLLGLLLIIRRR